MLVVFCPRVIGMGLLVGVIDCDECSIRCSKAKIADGSLDMGVVYHVRVFGFFDSSSFWSGGHKPPLPDNI